MITGKHIGKMVQVSDGTPRPPNRFNRKLADWEHRNYSGLLKDINLDTYTGKMTAEIETSRNSIMVIIRSGVPIDTISPQ